jgi:hypothetical protein
MLKLFILFVLKCLIGIVLLFCIFVLSLALVKIRFNFSGNAAMMAVAISFSTGIVLFAWGTQLMRFYVIGHELAHWMAAKLFNRKTGKMRLGKDSGSVEVEAPNIVIILAPYVIPFYSLLWLVVFGVTGLFIDLSSYLNIFFSVLGLSYAYHIVLTIVSIHKGQSDLGYYGTYFSLTLIICVNLLILYIGLMILSGNTSAIIPILVESCRKGYIVLYELLEY